LSAAPESIFQLCFPSPSATISPPWKQLQIILLSAFSLLSLQTLLNFTDILFLKPLELLDVKSCLCFGASLLSPDSYSQASSQGALWPVAFDQSYFVCEIVLSKKRNNTMLEKKKPTKIK